MEVKMKKRPNYYYIGLAVSIALSIKYLNRYGMTGTSVAIVGIIQAVYQGIYFSIEKMRKN